MKLGSGTGPFFFTIKKHVSLLIQIDFYHNTVLVYKIKVTSTDMNIKNVW